MNNEFIGTLYVPERTSREGSVPRANGYFRGACGHFRRSAVLAAALALATPLGVLAQGNAVRLRVTDRVDVTRLARLPGNTHPLARAQYDQGAAPPDLPMDRIMLVLKRGPDQEAALQDLLAQQQVTSSPNFHKWLTPDQFGQQFGPSDADIQAVTSWLTSFGFQSVKVSKGRSVIEFSGTASQVETALHTPIHRYVVNGKSYWANANDPQIPAALAPVVSGFASLHNFPKKLASVLSGQKAALTKMPGGHPQITFTDNSHGLAPADFNTIYNVAPTMTGSGVTIGVIARSNIIAQDVADFRNLFGLGGSNPNIILNGPDPGDLGTGEEAEAVLDATWPGAVAPNAAVDLVVSEATNDSAGEDLSEFYIIDNNLADVMTESFSVCEAGFGSQLLGASGAAAFYSSLAEQAAAQGITYLVASGDGGPDSCDDPSTLPVTSAASVNLLASTPFTVAVGGTQFNDTASPNTYWNATNAPTTHGSAKSYIPENVWNESCTVVQCGSLLAGLWSSGGGQSIVFPKPAWQSGVTGIPSGMRFVPDVSLAAANHDGYVLCIEASCEGSSPGFAVISGTSASAQVFGGVMALVVQKTGARVGVANYTLYKLAASEPPTTPANSSCNGSNTTTLPASTCVFNDVTVGNTDIPEVNPEETGFTAGVGYDQATGLGSVNVSNLVNQWNTAVIKASTTALILNSGNPVTITHGQSIPVSITVVAKSPATGIPTGDVSLVAASSTGQGADAFTLTNGSTPTGSTTTLLPGSPTPGGSYSVTAHYEGDGTFLGSNSSPVSVIVNPESSLTFLGIVNSLTNNATSIVYGSPYILSVQVTNSSDTLCNPNGIGGPACPTGTVALTDNGSPLDGTNGNFTLNTYGEFEDQPIQLLAGTHNLVAAYKGDNSFGVSTSTTDTVIVSQAATTVSVSANPTTVTAGQTVTLMATVATQSNAIANASQEPTQNLQFFVGGVAFGPLVAVSGSANANGAAQATASLPTTTLPTGSDSITAKYLGDNNYAASATSPSTTVTVGGAGINVSPGCNTATINITAAGQSGSCLMTVMGANGFSGSVTLSCAVTGAPSGAVDRPTCSFGAPDSNFTAPGTIALTAGSETGTATLTVNSTAASSLFGPARRPHGPNWFLLGETGAALACMFLFVFTARKRRGLVTLAGTLFMILAVVTGCGSGSSGGGNTGGGNPGTTLGAYTVTVTATPPAGASAQTSAITVNVN